MGLALVQCVHWKARPPHGGDCGAGLGFISPGTCARCATYEGPEPRLLSPPAPARDGVLSDARVAQVRGFQDLCRACPHWLGGFVETPGLPVPSKTRCEACGCVHKTVHLLSGKCPKNKWSNL
jgi:hypothetical protein